MKNLQTLFLKSLITFFITISTAHAFGQSSKIKQADELFKSKQYTQSEMLYQSVVQEKNYSPALLLKLAFIEEGLGKIGSALYYLKLYYLVSDDAQALHKMDELAAKHKINGYSLEEVDHLSHWFEKNRMWIIGTLTFLLFIACLFLFYKQKQQQRMVWSAVAIGVLSVGLLFVNNYKFPESVIIKSDNTYLMSGPSAAASVVAVLQEGNQFQTVGQDDVWVILKWEDKTAYVKNTSVLKINL